MYGTAKTKPEDVPSLLADRKITHPVLLDPTSAYRASMELAVYPTATLRDAEGRVTWRGQPYFRKAFAEACEEQIEALLEEESGVRAGAEPKQR